MSENQTPEQDLNEILKVRREKLKELQENGCDPFQQVKFDRDHMAAQVKENFETLEGQNVSVAGRLMSKRGMGKASFCDLADRSGRIQLYVRADRIGTDAYAQFKKYDIGDIIGVQGEVFRTNKGEISVKASTVTLLSKSL